MRPCSKCGQERDKPGQRYCRSCHAEYMRENRVPYSKMTEEQRNKSRVRAYANMYLKRGKIVRQDCFVCDGPSDHMHHEDYSRPLDILWLCKKCHLTIHSFHMEHRNPSLGLDAHG